MADKQQSNTAAIVGAGAAGGVLGFLASQLHKQAAAAPTDVTSVVDAIASYGEKVLQKLDAILTGGRAGLDNPSSFDAGTFNCAIVNNGYQMPTRRIPYNQKVAIVAQLGNLGIIRIGNSKANSQTASRSKPLVAGSGVTLKIKDMSVVWVSATVAGEGIEWIVEQD